MLTGNKDRSSTTPTHEPSVTRNTDRQDEKRICDRGHAATSLQLANTRGERSGRVFSCPECERTFMITPGLLVGGEVVRPVESDVAGEHSG